MMPHRCIQTEMTLCQRNDGYTQFVYLRARWLDPASGRFLSPDTWMGSIYQPSSQHKYLYVSADPVNRVDPTGKYECVDDSCCRPPPPDPASPTPRDYLEQHSRPDLRYVSHDSLWETVERSDLESLPARILLAMVSIGEAEKHNFTDLQYIMWMARTRVKFYVLGKYGYHAQLLEPGQFDAVSVIVDPAKRASGHGKVNFNDTFDPKGINDRGVFFRWYQKSYTWAQLVMTMDYTRMPKELRRSDSFAGYKKHAWYVRPLEAFHWFGDDFYRMGGGDNKFWDEYEQKYESDDWGGR